MRIAGEEASLQARNLVVELVLCYCTLFEVVPSTTGALADNACHFSACFSTSSIFEHLSHAPCIDMAAAKKASSGQSSELAIAYNRRAQFDSSVVAPRRDAVSCSTRVARSWT